MKKIFLILFSLLLVLRTEAYDWQSQSNQDLHNDMVTFARGFAKRAKGTTARNVVKKLLKQQKNFNAEPYAWIGQTVDAVLEMEKELGPCEDNRTKEALLRRDMLLLLDFPLHADNRASNAPEELKNTFSSVSDFYRAQARERALKELDAQTPLKLGELQVIKIYNCGIILRSCNHTIAIDIKWEGDSDGARKIASKVDAFFLSHPHRDHYSDVMIKALAEYNVPSVLPKNILPDVMWAKKKVVFEDVYTPFDVAGIQTLVQKGFQRDIPNNAYILEFDGWRVLLPGESKKYQRLNELSTQTAPDLILTPSWNNASKIFKAARMMQNYRASHTFCIPEHENELTHTVNHRESYRELFMRKDRLGDVSAAYPRIVLLDIGESYILRK